MTATPSHPSGADLLRQHLADNIEYRYESSKNESGSGRVLVLYHHELPTIVAALRAPSPTPQIAGDVNLQAALKAAAAYIELLNATDGPDLLAEIRAARDRYEKAMEIAGACGDGIEHTASGVIPTFANIEKLLFDHFYQGEPGDKAAIAEATKALMRTRDAAQAQAGDKYLVDDPWCRPGGAAQGSRDDTWVLDTAKELSEVLTAKYCNSKGFWCNVSAERIVDEISGFRFVPANGSPPAAFPAGEVRRLIETIEGVYGLTCEAGPLTKCGEWNALKRALSIPSTACATPDIDGWEKVGDGTPLNAWLETKLYGEEGSGESFCRLMSIGDEPEWIARDGRTTVTHHSYAAPTHWRWPKDCTCGGEPGQAANEHDISCPMALAHSSTQEKTP